jgi:hypothetical protein
MQITGETLEGAYRFVITVTRHGNYMKLGSHINTRGVQIYRGKPLLSVALFAPGLAHGITPVDDLVPRARTAVSIIFLTGIALRRHHTQIRNCPQAMFFYGVNATKKRTASPLGYTDSLGPREFVFLQVGALAVRGGFFIV